MIVYHDPRTLCALVVEHAAARSWKLREEVQMTTVIMSWPDGVKFNAEANLSSNWTAYGSNVLDFTPARLNCFILACRHYAKTYLPEVRFEPLSEEELGRRAVLRSRKNLERLEREQREKEERYRATHYPNGSAKDPGISEEDVLRRFNAQFKVFDEMEAPEADPDSNFSKFFFPHGPEHFKGNPKYHGMKQTFHKKY